MNKWEGFLKKASCDPNNKCQYNKCQCTGNQGLFIPNRQLSGLVAGLLFLFFCFFMAGYFIGKKYIIEQFVQDMHTISLQDSVVLTKNNYDIVTDAIAVTHDEKNGPCEDSHDCVVQLSDVATISQDGAVSDKKEQKYYAQLIGFGTEKAAEQFVKRTSTYGFVTEVKKRVSKTVKGRVSYWYQVVTAPYANKNDLLCVVDTLVKKERLKDVCIQMC